MRRLCEKYYIVSISKSISSNFHRSRIDNWYFNRHTEANKIKAYNKREILFPLNRKWRHDQLIANRNWHSSDFQFRMEVIKFREIQFFFLFVNPRPVTKRSRTCTTDWLRSTWKNEIAKYGKFNVTMSSTDKNLLKVYKKYILHFLLS